MEEMKGRCRYCNWAKFSWCSDGKRVSNGGGCKDWKPDKLSDASKKKQAAIQKAAHARDMKKRAKK